MPYATLSLPDLADLSLDDMDQEELEHAANALDALAKYASAKAEAVYHRHAGDIADAIDHERRCEIYFHRLPNNWRW
jgi:hypothetical protein